MDYEKRWTIIGNELGQGGQGTVHRVYDKTKLDSMANIRRRMSVAIQNISSRGEGVEERFFLSFREDLDRFIKLHFPENTAALKVLNDWEESRDFANAEERLRSEIEGMQEVTHPNLIKLLDVDDKSKWYVSKYYSGGNLAQERNRYSGHLLTAAKDFRGIVEGVTELHRARFVHRDIKPENIFIDSDGRLILGDFGLVIRAEDGKTRVTGTFENVGS